MEKQQIPATSAAGNLRQLAMYTFVVEVNGSLALSYISGRVEKSK